VRNLSEEKLFKNAPLSLHKLIKRNNGSDMGDSDLAVFPD
jgi:hypothetical protein